MKKKWIFAGIAILLLAVIFIPHSCSFQLATGNQAEDKAMAVKNANRFHELFNQQNQPALLAMVSPELQQKVGGEETWKQTFEMMKRELGEFRCINEQRIIFKAKAPPEIDVLCRTSFAQLDVMELFVFEKQGREMKLVGYTVDAQKMDLDKVEMEIRK